jgi:uncharacterized protein YcaQ
VEPPGRLRPAWLEQSLAEGKLFEYWAHEACFVPIEDYGLYRHRMLDPLGDGLEVFGHLDARARAEVERVLAHIRANGPTRSSDFERTDGQGRRLVGMEAGKALAGSAVHHRRADDRARHNFQRVYDLAERVLPGWDDSQPAAA